MPQAQATLGIIAHSLEVRERAFQLYKQTRDYAHVSLETGVPDATLRSWSSREKWATRIAAENAIPDSNAETIKGVLKVVSSECRPATPSNLDLAEKQAKYTDTMGDVALRIAEHANSLEGKELVQVADKLLKADAIARKALKLETEKPSTVINVALLSHSTEKQPRLVSDSSSLRELDDAPPSQS